MYRVRTTLLIACVAVIGGCKSASKEAAPQTPPSDPPPVIGGNEVPAPPAAALDPSRGSEIGLVFEAFLSPHQEPDEEHATPRGTPETFRSTAPSQSRDAREAAGHRGHGTIRFTRDLSRAFVDVKIEGVAIDSINMFHIHCGKPGILGPILVDFALATDIQKNFSTGVFSVVVTNSDIVKTAGAGHGLIAAFTAGCVTPSPSLGSVKPTKVSTVAGMAQIAREGELYFNLHTKGQTFYGDIRGQVLAAQ